MIDVVAFLVGCVLALAVERRRPIVLVAWNRKRLEVELDVGYSTQAVVT